MRENIKTIVFVASVALNLAFAATYATYKLPLFAGVRQPPARAGHLFLQLNLTPDQLKRFTVERDKFHGQLRELGQEIQKSQLELIDLLEATPPDQRAIEKKQARIQEKQREVQNRVIDHFLKASTFLTSNQRTRFFGLIRSRMQTGLQACPPMMSPVEPCEPGEVKNE